MATKTYAGINVDVNEEGYLTNPAQWTKEIAQEIAREEGITLTDKAMVTVYAPMSGGA